MFLWKKILALLERAHIQCLSNKVLLAVHKLSSQSEENVAAGGRGWSSAKMLRAFGLLAFETESLF